MNDTVNDAPVDDGEPVTPQLDTTALLYNCDNDVELANGVLEQTLTITPARLGRLTAGIATARRAAIQSEAHTLAGTFLTIGATPLGNLARHIELDAEAGRLAGMESSLRLLQASYEKLAQEIEAFLAKTHPTSENES